MVKKIVHVAISVDTTGPSDNAVNWFLSTSNLTNSSTLVIVHAVTKPTDKPNARKFLASYQSRCIASKKEYTMKSGLVYFKGKNTPDSIVKYCKDYSVDLLLLAPRPHDGLKFTGSTTDSITRTLDCDFLIWKPNKRPHLEIKTRDLTPRHRHRRTSLDAHLARQSKEPAPTQMIKEKMMENVNNQNSKNPIRRWSMGMDDASIENRNNTEGKPEEVAYVFGNQVAKTLNSP